MGISDRLATLRGGFTGSFWVANTLELFERFAYYASKAVLAVYVAEAVGLGHRDRDRAVIERRGVDVGCRVGAGGARRGAGDGGT